MSSWLVRNFGGSDDKSALLGLSAFLVVIAGAASAIIASFTGHSTISLDVLVALGLGALGYDAKTNVELIKAKYGNRKNDDTSELQSA